MTYGVLLMALIGNRLLTMHRGGRDNITM